MCRVRADMFLILVVVFTVRVWGHDSGSTQGVCQTGWKEFSGRCYYFSSDNKGRSWNQAKEECKRVHPWADLVSIGSQEDEDYIAKNAGLYIWILIGGTDADTEGQWKWTDGRPWVFSKWRGGEPNGGTRENCMTMKNPGSENFWNDSPCDFVYNPSPLICSYTPGPTYVVVTIGSSSSATKTLSGIVPVGYTCPSQASKDNWAGTDGYGDEFLITQDRTNLVVKRTDVSGSGWGMNLKIICSRQGCLIENNIDYYGNDFKHGGVFTQEQCASICYEEPECKYWTYSPSHNYCWRKTAKNRVPDLHPDRVSGEKVCGEKVVLDSECQSGWLPHDGKCYYFSGKENLSWMEAQTKCQSMRSNLASIPSSSVQTFMKNNLPNDVQYLFLGGMDQQLEGQWKWVDGEPWGYTNWYPGEPNNYNGNQDCVSLRDKEYQWNYIWNYRWDDLNCNAKMEDAHFVCSFRPESGDGPERIEVLYEISTMQCKTGGHTPFEKTMRKTNCYDKSNIKLCVQGSEDCYLTLHGRYKKGALRYTDDLHPCLDFEHTIKTIGTDKLSTYFGNKKFLLLNDTHSSCPNGYYLTDVASYYSCCECRRNPDTADDYCIHNSIDNHCLGKTLEEYGPIYNTKFRPICTEYDFCNSNTCEKCYK